MDMKRVFEIVKNKEITNIYYNEHLVWIQDVKDDIAKIGFLDGSAEKDVYIEDLYEEGLYDNENK